MLNVTEFEEANVSPNTDRVIGFQRFDKYSERNQQIGPLRL